MEKNRPNKSVSDGSLELVMSTLLINGFHIDKANRYSPTATLIYASKYDRLGANVKYGIMLVDDDKYTAVVDSLLLLSVSDRFTPILISDHFSCSECITYTREKFFSFFAGVVNTGLILIPSLPEIMDKLGHNVLPVDLKGEASDLHEMYVNECLQYVLDSPARRYGRERSFQSLPDNVILSKERFMVLVDCKSYKNGYAFDSDSIKRFAGYINDFNSRYAQYQGPIFCFLVVSGSFSDSEESVKSRSDELYKQANCRMSCLTSRDLAAMTLRLQKIPDIKGSLVWKNILIDLVISVKSLEAEVSRVEKDKLY